VAKVKNVNEDFFLQMCDLYVRYVNYVEKFFPKAKKIYYEELVQNTDHAVESLFGQHNIFEINFGMPIKDLLKNEYEFHKNIDSKAKKLFKKQEMLALVKYKTTVERMLNERISIHSPIKNTTLTDKKQQVSNFDKCLELYYAFAKNHNWIDQSKATFDFWLEKNV
jgi:hypothetical protein